jgi:hypothetical protein
MNRVRLLVGWAGVIILLVGPSAVGTVAATGAVVTPLSPIDRSEDPRGGHLVAVIAVICVLGVTTAIIRAILAQRTSKAVQS